MYNKNITRVIDVHRWDDACAQSLKGIAKSSVAVESQKDVDIESCV